MAITPGQVFASLLSDAENGKRCWPERRGSKSPVPPPSAEREVQVSATAEVSAPPNRARICMLVASRKEAAAAAKSSVTRRLEYIVQSVRAHGVREDAIIVTKDFRRIENAYQMEAEVSVIFSDFGKMESCCNLLVEKLDRSVVVGSPQFYHTTEAVENIRRQACLQAVANSRRKAFEVCRLLGQTLGRPLIVREEEIKETEGSTSEAQAPDSTRPLTIQQQISNASVTVCSKVYVTFELKSKDNVKRNN
ncbi:interleukin-1 receptor-associated kinase 1-binding protein 1 homolog [Hemiscyllium ocellatum]|uniref:interleukin-1 receptor-associated kinase 1-binding protein 1 homolog n=1 Tax=Hemiscyllium ocellatum TaxID=170820 RepID=UPI002966CD60|nr:interleukin-1 receptor-associated kinase 1-binding protein 1 homolog [Hemiscyllium ocellatum]